MLNLIDADGNRAGTYRYDPYGKPTLVEGTAAEEENPFRWIGGYQDNTDQPGGYIKLGARFHNPTTGAFTQPDPQMGNMSEPLRLNAYLYGLGDPCNRSDPSGRSPDDVVGGIACGLGIAGLVTGPITFSISTAFSVSSTAIGCSAVFEYDEPSSPTWNPAGGYTQYDHDSSH